MSVFHKSFFTCSITFLSPLVSYAQEQPKVEELLQELFLGQTVYPQEPFELQTTGLLDWEHSEEQDELIAAISAEFGITKKFQVELEVPFNVVFAEPDRSSGISNMGIGFLYNFINNAERGIALS